MPRYSFNLGNTRAAKIGSMGKLSYNIMSVDVIDHYTGIYDCHPIIFGFLLILYSIMFYYYHLINGITS